MTLTLPEDVLDALRSIHRDPGWAIVQLVQPMLSDGGRAGRVPMPKPVAELVRLPGRRSLIVVQPEIFAGLPGVSTIPLADGGAFLAFDRNTGPADLEVALLDRLNEETSKSTRHAQLAEAREIVRAWRKDAGLVFRTKSIIVVEGAVDVDRRPLAAVQRHDLKGVDASHGAAASKSHRRSSGD